MHAKHAVVAGLAVVLAGTACGAAAADGDPTPAPSPSGPLASALVLTAPAKLVDERKATLRLTWTTSDGQPVSGSVTLMRSTKPHAAGTQYKTVTTGADGTATLTVRPRVDTWWRALGQQATSAVGAVAATNSKVVKIDNVPPRSPVKLPKAAPKPEPLPAQPRAVGQGANAKVTKIPAKVWKTMVGVTWRSGCPVGRAGLRLMRVNYWGFDGYRHRGSMVAAASAIGKVASAFTALYNHHYPIRSMRPVDYFGYSKKDWGGDDDASMAHDNTSAFNCRWVGGVPGRVSNHALGIAIDINTWENPYQSPTGPEPDGWWLGHSQRNLTFRSTSDPLVKLLARHGLHWVLGMDDTQHFEVR
jgi:hypothetical protein